VLILVAGQESVVVELIHELSMKKVEVKWKGKLWDENYIYIYCGDNDRLYVLIAVKMKVVWNHYRGCQNTG
jgi:hypothetical protein